MTAPTRLHRSVRFAAVADVAAVLLFVAVGRRNHDEDEGLLDLLGTAAPLLAGLMVAWVVLRAWREPSSVRAGVRIWLLALAVALPIRAAVEGRLPVSFVIVAVLVLGLLLLGWRAVAARIR